MTVFHLFFLSPDSRSNALSDHVGKTDEEKGKRNRKKERKKRINRLKLDKAKGS